MFESTRRRLAAIAAIDVVRLMPFKKDKRSPESAPPQTTQLDWKEHERTARQERRTKFASFEKQARNARSGRDIVVIDKAYEADYSHLEGCEG